MGRRLLLIFKFTSILKACATYYSIMYEGGGISVSQTFHVLNWYYLKYTCDSYNHYSTLYLDWLNLMRKCYKNVLIQLREIFLASWVYVRDRESYTNTTDGLFGEQFWNFIIFNLRYKNKFNLSHMIITIPSFVRLLTFLFQKNLNL